MKKKIFEAFIDRVMAFPLWVRQVLYVYLAEDMKKNLCEEYVRINSANILALYSPILTFGGRLELSEHKYGWDNNIYSFLQACSEDYSLLDISLNKYFSMEETAKYFIFCLEQGYVESPESVNVLAMAEFISGKSRIGEYFLTKGLITNSQLEDSLAYASENGEMLGSVLFHKGYVAENDLKSLIVLKEESKRRFVVDYSAVPDCKSKGNCLSCDEDEILRLRDENKKLKQKLEKLLCFVKRNDD